MSTGSIQIVNLADNINAAFDKINENFELVETGAFGGGLDSANITNVVNQEFLSQFTLTTDVDLTDIEAGIAANAASLLTLQASITQNDSGISVLAAQQQATQAQLEGITLDGIDSDLLASAIANANTTLISRIDATDSSVSVFAANIDSVNASLLLLDSATQDRIDVNVNAINTLSASVTANSNGLSAVVADVTQLDLDLTQLISDGITLTPEQVTEAIGGALDDMTIRLDADSDKLSLEAQKITDLNTSLSALDSSTGALITAEADARATLSSRVDYNSDGLTSISGDLVELETRVGNDIAAASQSLQTQIDGLGGTTATWNLDLVAGTESNPHIAGIKFGNDGATAEFALTADTFRIVNASNTEIQPFTVVGDEVQLSNATVTGQLDIGTNETGSRMEMTNDVISIFEGSNLRVKLGRLS